MNEFTVAALAGIPEIRPGDDLAAIVAAEYGDRQHDGLIFVISQKVVSKTEGRRRRLSDVEAGEWAIEYAKRHDKDPRLVQVVLDESRDILRHETGVLISLTHSGFVCANAGVDTSNVQDDDSVLLLPADPDASARRLRGELLSHLDGPIGVVIADSFGRAWRSGQCDIAIGCAGVEPVADLRGTCDRDGRKLSATVIATADQLAAAADLARTKSSGEPVVVFTGLRHTITTEDGPGATAILRDRSQDLFP